MTMGATTYLVMLLLLVFKGSYAYKVINVTDAKEVTFYSKGNYSTDVILATWRGYGTVDAKINVNGVIQTYKVGFYIFFESFQSIVVTSLYGAAAGYAGACEIPSRLTHQRTIKFWRLIQIESARYIYIFCQATLNNVRANGVEGSSPFDGQISTALEIGFHNSNCIVPVNNVIQRLQSNWANWYFKSTPE